jgi:ribonucleoside-diphosphate reductase alpha chain
VEIEDLNRTICGTQTVEGAPHLADEHLPIFDCANTCGKIGRRFIATDGHIRMMAAAQPFISGAISKTINLPAESSVDDIADAYRLSWELGLKANALYRDGSKLSQPLNTKSDSNAVSADAEAEPVRRDATDAAPIPAAVEFDETPAAEAVETVERVVERIVNRPMRRRLPDTRSSLTHRFNVSGHEGYLTVGLYEDGCPGELFITMAKEGSTIGGLMDCLGTAISVALQYGVPIESLVKKFAHQRFEPMGMTTNSNIPFAKSLVDYIFRWLGMEFVAGYREANAPKRPAKVDNGRARITSPAKADESAPAEEGVGQGDSPAGIRLVTNGSRDPVIGPAPAPAPAASAEAGSSVATDVKRVVVAGTDDQAAMSESSKAIAIINALDRSNASLMGDAPACDVCGSITVRNGSCYKCMNCGNSMGCS